MSDDKKPSEENKEEASAPVAAAAPKEEKAKPKAKPAKKSTSKIKEGNYLVIATAKSKGRITDMTTGERYNEGVPKKAEVKEGNFIWSQIKAGILAPYED